MKWQLLKHYPQSLLKLSSRPTFKSSANVLRRSTKPIYRRRSLSRHNRHRRLPFSSDQQTTPLDGANKSALTQVSLRRHLPALWRIDRWEEEREDGWKAARSMDHGLLRESNWSRIMDFCTGDRWTVPRMYVELLLEFSIDSLRLGSWMQTEHGLRRPGRKAERSMDCCRTVSEHTLWTYVKASQNCFTSSVCGSSSFQLHEWSITS